MAGGLEHAQFVVAIRFELAVKADAVDGDRLVAVFRWLLGRRAGGDLAAAVGLKLRQIGLGESRHL